MRLPRKNRHARLELLPLMDVVFLILVFLVYAMMSMAIQRGMPVALPASTGAQPDQAQDLALTISQDGALWLDREAISLENLPHELERLRQERKIAPGDSPILLIYADAALPYQKLFAVLDALKATGMTKISLQARTPQ